MPVQHSLSDLSRETLRSQKTLPEGDVYVMLNGVKHLCAEWEILRLQKTLPQGDMNVLVFPAINPRRVTR